MKILNCEQGSDEWKKTRCGIPTSSNFDKIVDTAGKQSKQRKKYLYQLAGERITGKSEDTYQNNAMLRGIETETEARKFYELINNVTVEQIGLCVTEGNAIYAASPDGLVNEDGLIEIKCPLISTHVSYLLDNSLPTEYFLQTQGQLLVTGRKYVDFVSYYPGLKPLIIRIEPDKKFLKVLQNELELFCEELEKIVNKIK